MSYTPSEKIIHRSAAVSLTSTGVKNIALLPAGDGDFVWTNVIIRPTTITGAGTQPVIKIGWGGTPDQIVSVGATITPTAVGTSSQVTHPHSDLTVVPDGTQLAIDCTTATTGYSVYDVEVEIEGTHV